jgi:hypothetical protein
VAGGANADLLTMSQPCIQAETRILTAVQDVAVLTGGGCAPTARDRLCHLLGYRLYRSLVTGLVSA